MNISRCFCVVGPSGTGKTTLARGLAKNGVPEIVSVTDRPPRPGEVDGQHYSFVSKDSFGKMVSAGAFLEHVQYGGSRYGSTFMGVIHALEQGPACVVVDPIGAKQFKDKLAHNAVVIFLSPPPKEELRRRMLDRGDDPSSVEKRLSTIRAETDAGVVLADHVLFPASETEILRLVLRIIDRA